MGNKLILTGVTNNPGRVLVELLAQNIDIISELFPGGIRAVCRSSSDISHFSQVLPSAEVYTCDLTDVERLKRAFADGDTVLHMAGIHWSREAVVASASCKIRRLIAVHTCGIYSKYKDAGEEYRQIDKVVYDTCLAHNIAVTILRPTMIYGNKRDRNVIKFIRMVDKLPLMPIVNGGRYELQPVHYSDVGDAFYQVLLNEATNNHDYILSGKEPILLRDMFVCIGNGLGKRVSFISCPYWIAYPGAVFIYWLTLKHIDFREKVQRLCEPRAYPHQEAAAAFGFSPRSFQEGIVAEVAEYKRGI